MKRPCPEWLDALDDAAEAGKPSAALSDHLAICAGCRAELAALLRVAALIAECPAADPGPGFTADVLRRLQSARSPSWMAATALALVGSTAGGVGLAMAAAAAAYLWLGGPRVLTVLGGWLAELLRVFATAAGAMDQGGIALGLGVCAALALAAVLGAWMVRASLAALQRTASA